MGNDIGIGNRKGNTAELVLLTDCEYIGSRQGVGIAECKTVQGTDGGGEFDGNQQTGIRAPLGEAEVKDTKAIAGQRSIIIACGQAIDTLRLGKGVQEHSYTQNDAHFLQEGEII